MITVPYGFHIARYFYALMRMILILMALRMGGSTEGEILPIGRIGRGSSKVLPIGRIVRRKFPALAVGIDFYFQYHITIGSERKSSRITK